MRKKFHHQNNSFFDQHFDHSAAKILKPIQYKSEHSVYTPAKPLYSLEIIINIVSVPGNFTSHRRWL
jgi:hypothetical protein